MIERRVVLHCDHDGCKKMFSVATHDATYARKVSREFGWVVSRVGRAGVFTDYCTDHKDGVALTSRYRIRKVEK